MDESYGRMELPGGLQLEAEYDPVTQSWAMWLEVNGVEVEADPYAVLGGSVEKN